MDSTNLSYHGSFGVANFQRQEATAAPASLIFDTAWRAGDGLLSMQLPSVSYFQNNGNLFAYGAGGDGTLWNTSDQNAVGQCGTMVRNGIPTPPLSSPHASSATASTDIHGTYTTNPIATTPSDIAPELCYPDLHTVLMDQNKNKAPHAKVSRSKGKGKGKAAAKPRALSDDEAFPFSPASSSSASRRTLRTAARKKDETDEDVFPASPPLMGGDTDNPEQQERLARAKHNDVEREYRNRLNLQYRMLIDTLDEATPQSDGRRKKDLSKAEVLEMARQRIQMLGDEIGRSSDENKVLKDQVSALLGAIQQS